jgi:glutamate racemase
VLQRCLGRGVTIVSSGEAIADEVERALEAAGLAADPARRGVYRFLASGGTDAFRAQGTRFLQLPIEEVRHVEVAKPRARRAA